MREKGTLSRWFLLGDDNTYILSGPPGSKLGLPIKKKKKKKSKQTKQNIKKHIHIKHSDLVEQLWNYENNVYFHIISL